MFAQLKYFNKYFNIFLITLIIISILLLANLSNHFFITFLNSDYLYLFETAKFLFSHQTLAGQNEPLAPYYFPDLALLTLLNIFTKNILLQHFTYAIIFLTTYCILVYQLIQLCFTEKVFALLGTLLALSAGFFIILPHFTFLEEWSGSHFSIIIFSLFFINFYVRTLQKPLKLSNCIGFFLLIFAMFISDRLLFPQFLLPIAILILFDKFQKKISRQKTLFWLGLFFLMILLSLEINKLLQYFDISTSYNANLFRIRNIHKLHYIILNEAKLCLMIFKENIFIYGLLLLYQLSSIFLFKKNRQLNHLSRIILFLWAAELSNFLLVILSGKFNTIEHLRYLSLLYFYPPILFSFSIVFFLAEKKYAVTAYVFSMLCIACSLGFFLKTYSTYLTYSIEPLYTENVRCIDGLKKQYAIQNGLAQYWYMREVRLLSHQHIQISQIDKWLNRVNYLDNKTNFYEKRPDIRPLFYQFIIVNALPKNNLIKQFGKPDQIVFCQNDEIWLYQSNIHLVQLNQAIVKKKIVQY